MITVCLALWLAVSSRSGFIWILKITPSLPLSDRVGLVMGYQKQMKPFNHDHQDQITMKRTASTLNVLQDIPMGVCVCNCGMKSENGAVERIRQRGEARPYN